MDDQFGRDGTVLPLKEPILGGWRLSFDLRWFLGYSNSDANR
jgi:hypothetical protein